MLPFLKGKLLWPLLQGLSCTMGLWACGLSKHQLFSPLSQGVLNQFAGPLLRGWKYEPLFQRVCCQTCGLVAFQNIKYFPFPRGSQQNCCSSSQRLKLYEPLFQRVCCQTKIAKNAGPGLHVYFLHSSDLIFLASSLEMPSFSKAVLIMSIIFTYCLLIFSFASTMSLGLSPLLLHPHRYALGGLVGTVLVILYHAPVHPESSAAGMLAAGFFKLPVAAGFFHTLFQVPNTHCFLEVPMLWIIPMDMLANHLLQEPAWMCILLFFMVRCFQEGRKTLWI